MRHLTVYNSWSRSDLWTTFFKDFPLPPLYALWKTSCLIDAVSHPDTMISSSSTRTLASPLLTTASFNLKIKYIICHLSWVLQQARSTPKCILYYTIQSLTVTHNKRVYLHVGIIRDEYHYSNYSWLLWLLTGLLLACYCTDIPVVAKRCWSFKHYPLRVAIVRGSCLM